MATRRFFDGAQIEIGSLPIELVAAAQTIIFDRLESTAQIFLPTITQAGGTQTITLNRLESTAQVFNLTVIRQASSVISLNRLESTVQIFLPTVTQAGGTQTITLNLLGSTSQIFLPTITSISSVIDTSDILTRYKRKRSESKEEEEIAAQLLKARQKRPEVEQKNRELRNWKKLIYEAIYGADTVEELEAITTPPIPTDSPEVVAAILAEIEQQKAARKAEIELKQAELKLKMEEASLQAAQLEAQISERIDEQKRAIQAIKDLQQEVMTRHAVAVEAARQIEMQAFLQLQDAERKAEEFTRKRNNRIKRLKALMWLAKIDL
jgi:hypothetical protein